MGIKMGLVQSLSNWGAVAAVRQNAGFADRRKFSRVLANRGYGTSYPRSGELRLRH
jgi:hypothetical protein